MSHFFGSSATCFFCVDPPTPPTPKAKRPCVAKGPQSERNLLLTFPSVVRNSFQLSGTFLAFIASAGLSVGRQIRFMGGKSITRVTGRPAFPREMRKMSSHLPFPPTYPSASVAFGLDWREVWVSSMRRGLVARRPDLVRKGGSDGE